MLSVDMTCQVNDHRSYLIDTVARKCLAVDLFARTKAHIHPRTHAYVRTRVRTFGAGRLTAKVGVMRLTREESALSDTAEAPILETIKSLYIAIGKRADIMRRE